MDFQDYRHIELLTSSLVLLYNYDSDRARNAHSNGLSYMHINEVVSKIELFETKRVYCVSPRRRALNSL